MGNGFPTDRGVLLGILGFVGLLPLSVFAQAGVVVAGAGVGSRTELLAEKIGRLESLLETQQARTRSLRVRLASVQRPLTDAATAEVADGEATPHPPPDTTAGPPEAADPPVAPPPKAREADGSPARG